MLVEALADSETLNELETDWLVDTEALVLDDSLSDVDSLIETEAETLVEALADSETLIESEIDWFIETEALVLCDSETDVETD